MDEAEDTRRAVVAMCCAVARADGKVTGAELETLFEILFRFGLGTVSHEELTRWLDEGPPDIPVKLEEDQLRDFIRSALHVANADGHVDDRELLTIKKYAERLLA
jgi:tellurite resistance protein